VSSKTKRKMGCERRWFLALALSLSRSFCVCVYLSRSVSISLFMCVALSLALSLSLRFRVSRRGGSDGTGTTPHLGAASAARCRRGTHVKTAENRSDGSRCLSYVGVCVCVCAFHACVHVRACSRQAVIGAEVVGSAARAEQPVIRSMRLQRSQKKKKKKEEAGQLWTDLSHGLTRA